MKLNLLLLCGLLLIVSCAKSIDDGRTPDTPPTNGTWNGIPVVFHVLYENADDSRQNPSHKRFVEITQKLNNYYAGKISDTYASTPIDVKFELATHNPSGNKMTEAGVQRVRYDNSVNMSPDDFLYSEHPEGSANSKIFWDPNHYVNIWVFGFDEKNVAGVAFFPYNSSTNPLEGLNNGDIYFSRLPDYMHGIAINNNFIDDIDIEITLAHEMGHYLGLYHPFDGQETCVSTDDAADDFCSDTPIYDRNEYEAEMNAIENPTLERAVLRVSCSGKKFISTNIMDYSYGYECTFTPQQRDRIEHVLKYSPLIPRKDNTQRERMSKMAIDSDELPIPIIIR